MLKKLLLAGSFFILCANSYGQTAAATQEAQSVTGSPQFSLTNKDNTFDFCELEEGDVVKHEFLFRNTGTGPLFINNVYSEVKNASFRWPSRIIKPGKTGIILVTYRSFMDVGSVAGDIHIASNASKEDITPLHIRGKVIRYGCCDKDKSASK